MESGVTTYFKTGLFNRKVLSEYLLEKIVTTECIEVITEYVHSDQKLDCMRIFALDSRVLWLLSGDNYYAKYAYSKVNLILPDGRPLYWIKCFEGHKAFEQMTGPGLFQTILSHSELKKRKHIFYGGSKETMEQLVLYASDNQINLVYHEAPPFLTNDNLDIEGVQNILKEYQPDFFWCGLGAPKQEYLISQLSASNVIMIGVGLAFDYVAGKVKKPPKFLSKIGMEWMVRYAQQPKRLKRFILPFIFALGLLIRQGLIGILSYYQRRK